MQTDTVVADIAARLARLEKSNRRLRLTLVAVVVAASSLALAAAGRQDSKPVVAEVRATRFVLDDGSGKEVASLASLKGQGTRLLMSDETGAPNVVLFSSRSMDSMLSLGREGKSVCILSAGAKGGEVIARRVIVIDENAKRRAELGTFEADNESKQSTSLQLFNFANDSASVMLGCDADGPDLILLDKGASVHISAKAGLAAVGLKEQNGQGFATLFASPDGSGGLSIGKDGGSSTSAEIAASDRNVLLKMFSGSTKAILSCDPANAGLTLTRNGVVSLLGVLGNDAGLTLQGSKGSTKTILGSLSDGSGILSFGDSSDTGIPANAFGRRQDGAGYLALTDGARSRLALGPIDLLAKQSGVTESRPASSIVLFGPDGSVIERLPR